MSFSRHFSSNLFDFNIIFLKKNILKIYFFQNKRLESTNIEDKSEAILIYLSFNLARGHLKSVLDSIFIILGQFKMLLINF